MGSLRHGLSGAGKPFSWEHSRPLLVSNGKDRGKQRAAMAALNVLNGRFGAGTLFSAGQGVKQLGAAGIRFPEGGVWLPAVIRVQLPAKVCTP